MEHLRMSGAYWGLTGLDIMGRLGDMSPDEIVPWVIKCQDECGNFLLKPSLELPSG
jgi:geranylgeranyl transferase type-2 subunit beta